MNHFLLHLLVRDIGETLRGLRIEAVRVLKPLAVFRLAGRGAGQFLVVVISHPGPFCFLDAVDPLADAGDDVFRRIWGDRIDEAPQAPHDRIVRLPLEKSRHTLSISLRGSAARIRVEGPDTIVESLDARESGSAVGPPLPPGESLATLPDGALAAALEDGREVHGVERPLLEAFRDEGGLDTESLVGFRNSVRDGKTPFCLGAGARPGRVVPLPGGRPDRVRPKLEYLFGPFHGAGAACTAVGREIVETVTGSILERHALPLRKRLGSRRALVDKLRSQLAEASAFDAGRREANILAAYQSQVPAGAGEVELPDLYAPGETVTIRLDPALPVESQIEKRFKRAAKLERSRDALARRITVVEEEARAIESAIAEAEGAATFRDALLGLRAATDRAGVRGPRPATQGGREEKRYRRFDLDPSWFVLVGRSDRENDDITFRVAGPDDIWLHAQQTAGSHAVLKSSGGAGNPPREVLDAAAAIAAFYSKARHSGLVPVIYTRRKYVRKFRGAKPGQVTCEREKTLFVAPRLPE